MNHNAKKTGSLAISAALLVGAGAAAIATPASAQTTDNAASNSSSAIEARFGNPAKATVSNALIVHRSGKAATKAALSAAPKAAPAKKSKKRYRSRRS